MNATNNATIQARNAKFIANCLNIIEKNQHLGLRAAVRLALAMKPDCYYVTFEQARTAISKLKGTRKRCAVDAGHNNVHVKQWEEIERHIEARMFADPEEDYNSALLYVITRQRPSQFFISEDRAMRLMRPYITHSHLLSLKKS
jgi:hypothetical protein